MGVLTYSCPTCCGGGDCQCPVCKDPCKCVEYTLTLSGVRARECDDCTFLNDTFTLVKNTGGGCCWTYSMPPNDAYNDPPDFCSNFLDITLCVHRGGTNRQYEFRLTIESGIDSADFCGVSDNCLSCTEWQEFGGSHTCHWSTFPDPPAFTLTSSGPTPELPDICAGSDCPECCCCIKVHAPSDGNVPIETWVKDRILSPFTTAIPGVSGCCGWFGDNGWGTATGNVLRIGAPDLAGPTGLVYFQVGTGYPGDGQWATNPTWGPFDPTSLCPGSTITAPWVGFYPSVIAGTPLLTDRCGELAGGETFCWPSEVTLEAIGAPGILADGTDQCKIACGTEEPCLGGQCGYQVNAGGTGWDLMPDQLCNQSVPCGAGICNCDSSDLASVPTGCPYACPGFQVYTQCVL